MIEVTDEHDPASWMLGMLGVIGDQIADGRRGVIVDDGTTLQITTPTDSGCDVVLTLTIEYRIGD